MLESVYERLLAQELTRRGLHVERQKPVAFGHEGLRFDGKLVIDLLVNECVVVEIKAAENTLPLYRRQTYTYLRLLDLRVGLLLNFGAPTMKTGIQRIVNGYRPSPQSRLRIHRDGTSDRSDH